MPIDLLFFWGSGGSKGENVKPLLPLDGLGNPFEAAPYLLNVLNISTSNGKVVPRCRK